MNEIRFSQSRNEPEVQTAEKKKRSVLKAFLKVIVTMTLLVVLLLFAWFAKGMFIGRGNVANPDSYSAVFLNNGQVYFGKIESKNSAEMIISNVYYLQLSDGSGAQAQLTEPKFSLIKLGNELHGPTNEMFINMQNVLFYEHLRDDSKVVQSIKDQI